MRPRKPIQQIQPGKRNIRFLSENKPICNEKPAKRVRRFLSEAPIVRTDVQDNVPAQLEIERFQVKIRVNNLANLDDIEYFFETG